ncbi:hypothetical protein Plhal710r2_c006g0029251 [Plasmopara halstedii]
MTKSLDCLPHLRVFIDLSLLVLSVLIAFVLHHQIKKKKCPINCEKNALYDHFKSQCRWQVTGIALGLVMWSIFGFILCGTSGCLTSNWLVILCLLLSGVTLLIGTWMILREAFLTIDVDVSNMYSSLEIARLIHFLIQIFKNMIQYFRCMCCSRITKRALLLPILILLILLNLVDWHHIKACKTSKVISPSTYFAGTICVYLTMLLATMLTVCCPIFRHSRLKYSRSNKTVVVLGLALFSLTSITWSIVGLFSIIKRHEDPFNCWNDHIVLNAARWSILQLLLLEKLPKKTSKAFK